MINIWQIFHGYGTFRHFKNIHTENLNKNLAVKQKIGNVRFTVISDRLGMQSKLPHLDNMNRTIPGLQVETKTQNSFNLKDLKHSITREFNQQLPKIEKDDGKFFSQKESNENNYQEFSPDNDDGKKLHVPKKGLDQIISIIQDYYND